jgi:hypothetical protein
MPRKREVIRNMPLRTGLATAGKQGTIGEDQLWRAENVSSGLDGLLMKRPGIRQWGQVIKQPRLSATGEYLRFYEAWASAAAWRVTNGDTDTYTYQTKQGELIINAAGDDDADTFNMGRQLSGGETAPTGNDWSARFLVRTLNLPRGDVHAGDSAYAGGINDGGHLTVRGRALVSNAGKAFRLYYDGLYYFNGSGWTRLVESDIGDSQYHVLEIRVDADGSVVAYIDDDTSITGTVAATSVSSDVAITAGEYLELVLTNDAGTWTCRLADLMYKDSVTTPFEGQRISAVADYKTVSESNRTQRSILAATAGYVYADVGLKQAWRPIMALTGGQPQFASYRTDLIIFDGDNANSAKVYSWNGEDAPELLGDAPPVRFGTEHGTRLFAAGDKGHPLRVYHTASREKNTWFAPEVDPDETYDEVTEAGFFEIPGNKGDEVTGVYGDFNGFCIVTTTRGLWGISGAGPETYDRKDISRSQSGAGPNAIVRVGNDLWTMGRTGVCSIQTTQNYGDLLTVLPSGPIGDLWSSDPSVPRRIDKGQIDRTILTYNPTLGLVYMSVPQLGQNDLSALYVFNVGLQTWYGPWVIDSTAMAGVEVADPVTNTILHGTGDGYLGITDLGYKQDFGSTTYQCIIESPYLSGRSIDPAYVHQVKTWKVLRLYIQPRGDWNITIRWSSDDDPEEQTRTISQNTFKWPVLGDTFRLGDAVDGRIHTAQLIGTLEIPLDVRGRFFKFSVETDEDYDGEDFVLQGYEVEFTLDATEQED